MTRNVYGDRLGLLAQLEITWSDGIVETVATDADVADVDRSGDRCRLVQR